MVRMFMLDVIFYSSQIFALVTDSTVLISFINCCKIYIQTEDNELWYEKQDTEILTRICQAM
jgi:hypothetical protein